MTDNLIFTNIYLSICKKNQILINLLLGDAEFILVLRTFDDISLC